MRVILSQHYSLNPVYATVDILAALCTILDKNNYSRPDPPCLLGLLKPDVRLLLQVSAIQLVMDARKTRHTVENSAYRALFKLENVT
jgi:hypothetical protein